MNFFVLGFFLGFIEAIAVNPQPGFFTSPFGFALVFLHGAPRR